MAEMSVVHDYVFCCGKGVHLNDGRCRRRHKSLFVRGDLT